MSDIKAAEATTAVRTDPHVESEALPAAEAQRLDTDDPWTVLSAQVVYENPWIELTHNRVLTPGGNHGVYGVVHFKNQSVGVLPIDADGFIWLVGQYRFAIGRYSWEIPAGGCPADEDPLLAARRELREETGFVSTDMQQLCVSHLSNAICDEQTTIFIARGLEPGPAQPDDNEKLAVRRIHLHTAVDMMRRGDITDAVTMLALLSITPGG